MVSPCGDDFFVGATFGRPHGLYKFKPCRFQKRAVEGASPYSFFGQICHAAKSLRSLRIYILLRDRENGADFVFRYYIYIKHNFCVLFLIKSAPSRLSPIEALPQTPQGTLSLDPASPLTPGLSLRFISRSARCCLLLHI